jgi:predicted RNA-binding protein YlxR (DUF448 family)
MAKSTNDTDINQIRTCIVTGIKALKADMIRLVSYQKGPVTIDLSGKLPGRGANVSVDHANLDALIAKNGAVLARAFKKQITPEEIEYFKTEFPKAVEEKLFRPRTTKPVKIIIDKNKLDTITNR